MVLTSGQDASWMSPLRGVSGMLLQETLGQTKDMLERLHLSAGLKPSLCPPRGVAGSGWGEDVWISLLRLLSPPPDKWQKKKEIKQGFNTTLILLGHSFFQY